jgi:hypothetical protein
MSGRPVIARGFRAKQRVDIWVRTLELVGDHQVWASTRDAGAPFSRMAWGAGDGCAPIDKARTKMGRAYPCQSDIRCPILKES